jgi:RimJ/RimL family protein N-acetyltransferase
MERVGNGLVAKVRGTSVATLETHEERDPHRPQEPIIKINSINTVPIHQGKGIAQQLIRRLIWRLSEYNRTHPTPFSAIRADSDSKNRVYQHVLTKLGFHETGRTPLEARGGDEIIHYVFILDKK